MTYRCCDCRHTFDAPAEGRLCPRCRSGVLRGALTEPRTSGVNLTEGTESCDAC